MKTTTVQMAAMATTATWSLDSARYLRVTLSGILPADCATRMFSGIDGILNGLPLPVVGEKFYGSRANAHGCKRVADEARTGAGRDEGEGLGVNEIAPVWTRQGHVFKGGLCDAASSQPTRQNNVGEL